MFSVIDQLSAREALSRGIWDDLSPVETPLYDF